MSNSIGNLAVTLSLDAAAFSMGLDKSSKDLKAFAGGASAVLAGLSAAEAVTSGVGSAVTSMYQEFKMGLNEIVETGARAKSLGVSLNTLAGIESLAAGHTEELDHALLHLNKHIQEAARGSAEALDPINQLGLDAAELAAMPLDKALGKVADALNKTGSESRSSAIALELFGKGSSKILQDLAGGAISVEEAVKRMTAAGGFGFNAHDLKNTIDAQHAIAEMELSFTRIKNEFLVAFAPVAKALADNVSDIANKGGDLKSTFKGAANALLTGLEAASDLSFDLLITARKIEKVYERITNLPAFVAASAHMPLLGIAAQGLIAGANYGVASIGDTADPLQDELARARDAAKKTYELGRKAINDAGDDKGNDGDTPYDAAAEKAKKLGEEADKLAAHLRDEIDAFGQVSGSIERFKLAHEGATDAQLAGVDAALKQLDALKKTAEETKKATEETQKLNDEAKRINEDGVSGYSKFADQIVHLNELKQHGLTDDNYALEVAKDFKDLTSGMDKHDHAPGALMQGSMEAHSQEVAWERQGKGQSIPDILKEIKEQDKERLQLAKDLVREMRAQTEVVKDRLVGHSISP